MVASSSRPHALPSLPDRDVAGGRQQHQLACLLEAMRRRADAVARESAVPGAASREHRRVLAPCAAPREVHAAIQTVSLGEPELLKLKQASHCVICCVDFKAEEVLASLPGCSHLFHSDCVQRWLSRASTCPLCRENLVEAVGLNWERCPASLVAQHLADRAGAADTFVAATLPTLQLSSRERRGTTTLRRLPRIRHGRASAAAASAAAAARHARASAATGVLPVPSSMLATDGDIHPGRERAVEDLEIPAIPEEDASVQSSLQLPPCAPSISPPASTTMPSAPLQAPEQLPPCTPRTARQVSALSRSALTCSGYAHCPPIVGMNSGAFSLDGRRRDPRHLGGA